MMKRIWKEVSEVMAMLMALRIVEGKYFYHRVPKLLKKKVDDCLLSLGYKVVDGKLVEVEA